VSSVKLKAWLDGKPSRKALYDKAKALGYSGNLKGLRHDANLQGADADLQLSKMGAENLTSRALLLFKANRQRATSLSSMSVLPLLRLLLPVPPGYWRS
jgi:hypothetical protein